MERSPADTLNGIGKAAPVSDPRTLQVRRLTFVVLFRVILISLVLGGTTLLYWLSDADLTTASAITVFAVIGVTYLLTIIYSLAIGAGRYIERLGIVQLIADLAIATVIVHATGGAQSAYTFLFPVAIIGAAVVAGRREIILLSGAALALFVLVSLLGWSGALPVMSGQEIRPDALTPLALLRALALNGAAIIGVALLSINLGSQLQQTRSSLATQTSAAADLRTLHSDIVRSLASGLMTIDSESRINSINREGRRILGAMSNKLVGDPLAEVFPSIAARARGDGLVRRAEETVLVGDKHIVLGVSLSPLYDRNHELIGQVVNFQDLTELRSMENQVKRAERLAVIGRLAAGVAHEIRNPLAAISGSIELLRTTVVPSDGDDENAALMEIVTREIDRLNALITELLDYTNPGKPNRDDLDLAALVRDTASVFVRDPEFSAVELDLRGLDEPVEINGDSEKLRQVIWNLLRNAAEAASDGGGHVRVVLTSHGSSVVLSIEDDGKGISLEDIERIFEPFFTTKDGGTGLGLAIVHSLVEEHGGTITAESELGARTTFRVELPYNLSQ